MTRRVEPLCFTPLKTTRKDLEGLEVIEPTRDSLIDTLSQAKMVQDELRQIPLLSRIEALDQLGKLWAQRANSEDAHRLIEELSKSTRYSQQLISFEHKLLPEVLSAENLKGNIDTGLLGGAESLNGFVKLNRDESITSAPAGPVLIISSGNSLIPPIIPTVLALLTGNMVILKPSLANHSGIVEVFKGIHQLNSAAARSLSKALLVTYLTHDSEAMNYLLSEAKIGVINYWGAEPGRSVVANKVNSNPNHPRFIVNGPLTGVALIDQESASKESADHLALNTVLYDQQLCSSPTQIVFIGRTEEAENFMKMVGSALDSYGPKMPMITSEGGIYTIQSVRKALTINGGKVLSSNDESNPWTILINRTGKPLRQALKSFPAYIIHARKRFLEASIVPNVNDAAEIVEGVSQDPSYKGIEKVQTLGTALSPENLEQVLTRMALSGVYRIVPLQDMYMRSKHEPYDGLNLPSAFTYTVYHRSHPIQGA